MTSEALESGGRKRAPRYHVRPDHRLIYTAIQALDAAGTATDVITVQEELTRTGHLQDVGGPAYLGTLVRETPTAVNIGHHAGIVAERARLRRLQDLGGDIAKAIADGSAAAQITEAVQSALKTSAAAHVSKTG
jgi:replicative DNA helicase